VCCVCIGEFIAVALLCSDYVLQHDSRDEHIPPFLHWLSEHGVDTSIVAIEQFADAGYGLKAVRDIEVNAGIWSCVTYSTACKTYSRTDNNDKPVICLVT